jgi:hypothetical protein
MIFVTQYAPHFARFEAFEPKKMVCYFGKAINRQSIAARNTTRAKGVIIMTPLQIGFTQNFNT